MQIEQTNLEVETLDLINEILEFKLEDDSIACCSDCIIR